MEHKHGVSSIAAALCTHMRRPIPTAPLPTTPREPEFEKGPIYGAVKANLLPDTSQTEGGGWTAAWDTRKPDPPPTAVKRGNSR